MDYKKQANDFLLQNNLTLTIKETETRKLPLWTDDYAKCGQSYIVTIRDEHTKRKINFLFWGSIKDFEDRKKPDVYSVLACLTPDFSDSFEDFCRTYGYETDSRKALKTYKAVKAETKKLQYIFNEKQLKELQDIN